MIIVAVAQICVIVTVIVDEETASQTLIYAWTVIVESTVAIIIPVPALIDSLEDESDDEEPGTRRSKAHVPPVIVA